MTSRPTDNLSWAASAAPADVSEPTPAVRAAGFPFRFIPPHQWINWLYRAFGRWAAYLNLAPVTWDALDDALAALAAGETFTLDERDSQHVPGTRADSAITGYTVVSIAADGQRVIWTNGTDYVEVQDRDFTVIGEVVLNGGGATLAITRIISDGTHIAVAYDDKVELFLASTRASVWVYDHNAAVEDICMDSTQVYLVGASGTGGADARALNRTTGLAVWSFNHGGTLRSCCCWKDKLFVRGVASSLASGATMRSLRTTDGASATNEGGTPDAGARADFWNQVEGVVGTFNRTMCTDGKYLYVGYQAAAADIISVRSVYDGAEVRAGTQPVNYDCTGICVDQDFVFATVQDLAAPPEGYLYCYDKRTMNLIWVAMEANDSPPPAARAYWCIASDGAAVFLGGEPVGIVDRSLLRVYRGNRPVVCRKIDPTTDASPYAPPVLFQEGG